MTDSPNVWDTPENSNPVNNAPQEGVAGQPDPAEAPEEAPEESAGTEDDLRQQMSELRRQLATTQAELANHRARKAKDLDAQYEAGRGEVITNLVPVLDSIAGAKEHGDLDVDNPLTPVLKSLTQTLEGLGLGAIGDEGDDFDPRIHEALHVDYSDEVEGTKVGKVHQHGYATSDRLLRPALVTVIKKKS